MTNFHYVDLSLKFAENKDDEVTPVFFKKNIKEALNELFGEVGSSVNIDLLKFNSSERRGPNKKDIVIFATKDDHQIPSKVKLPEPDPQPGLILPNGDINWNCPCLGGMATGPCGVEFRNAFSCFHYSEGEPKGSDCYDLFKSMQNCMQRYPTLYNKDLADDDDLNGMGQVEATKKDDKSEPEPATKK
ncbi:hypothetical protein JTB14_014559 [Gonioctena quinquepunctata]|nr:hypothetical protein JTB14_014559 [Gonioctena quinquepunctata]